MATNLFREDRNDNKSPAISMFSIVKSDTVDLPFVIRQMYVGTGGDISLMDTTGNVTPHKNVPSGAILGPFQVCRVMAVGTSADLVGYV